MDLEKEERLYDWIYKPHQLCQSAMFTGNMKVANLFCRKVFNKLIQEIYNYNVDNPKKLNNETIIDVDLDNFMEDLNIANISNLKRSIRSIQTMSIVSFHSLVNFKSVCLITEIDINSEKNCIEFKVHDILVNMIKSKFKLVDYDGNIVSQKEDDSKSCYYARMYALPPKELKNSEYGVMAFYEYIIASKNNINDIRTIHNVSTEKFLNIVGANNSTKNSEILNILNRIINRLEDVYGLKVIYKCNRNKTKYDKISSISIKVFMTDKDIEDKLLKYKMHLNPLDKNNPKIDLFFPIYDNSLKLFTFKSQEDFKFNIDNFFTNMVSYTHENYNKIDKLLEGLLCK